MSDVMSPAAGVELLQPTTAVAGVLLALLIGNSLRVALLSTASAPRRELALQAQITQAATRRGAQVASVLGAVVVLMYRRLSGLSRVPFVCNHCMQRCAE